MQVAKTLTYPVMCIFTLFVALYVITIHQCYRQTDRQTDVMLVAYCTMHMLIGYGKSR